MTERKPDGTTTGPTDEAAAGRVPPPPGGDTNPPADDPPNDGPAPAVVKPAPKRPSKRPAAKSTAAKTAAAGKGSSAAKDSETPEAAARPAPSRPMTAADYARTVSADPSSTAVFPRVTDDDDRRTENPYGASAGSAASTPAAESAVTRQARLSLVHVDPWSVTQLAFVVSTALMIVAVVAVTVFWVVLNVTGVWNSLNDTVNSVLSSEDGTFDVENYLGFGRVVGLTLVLSAINVVLMTALAAIGARLYNAATHLVGGVQVTFRDRG